jgi:hypothetical protein
MQHVRQLHTPLHVSAYTVRITQELKPDDRPKWLDLAIDMLHWIDMYRDFLPVALFYGKAAVRLWGKVSQHKTRM